MAHIPKRTKQLHVKKWKESGLGLQTYALKVGIPETTMRSWKTKYDTVAEPSPHFIALSSPADEPTNGAIQADTMSPQIELAFPSGLILKIYG